MLQKFYETNKRFSKEFQISEKIKLKNLKVYIKHRVGDTKVHRWCPDVSLVHEGLVLKSLVAAEGGSGE